MTIDFQKLRAPFDPSIVHWRVGSTTKDKKKGMALAYIDARHVMDRLDEVCGPGGWQSEHFDAGNGKLGCKVGIIIDGACVWKSDGGGDTDYEAEKGAFSTALKRAAVQWGIGRYLYDIKSPWVQVVARGKSYVIADHEASRLQKLLPGSSVETEKPPLSPDSADGGNGNGNGTYTISTKTADGGSKQVFYWLREFTDAMGQALDNHEIEGLQRDNTEMLDWLKKEDGRYDVVQAAIDEASARIQQAA